MLAACLFFFWNSSTFDSFFSTYINFSAATFLSVSINGPLFKCSLMMSCIFLRPSFYITDSTKLSSSIYSLSYGPRKSKIFLASCLFTLNRFSWSSAWFSTTDCEANFRCAIYVTALRLAYGLSRSLLSGKVWTIGGRLSFSFYVSITVRDLAWLYFRPWH